MTQITPFSVPSVERIGPNALALTFKTPSGRVSVLVSYETPVAISTPFGLYRREAKWTRTTEKHIRQFQNWDGRWVAEYPNAMTKVSQESFDRLLKFPLDVI